MLKGRLARELDLNQVFIVFGVIGIALSLIGIIEKNRIAIGVGVFLGSLLLVVFKDELREIIFSKRRNTFLSTGSTKNPEEVLLEKEERREIKAVVFK